MQQFLIRNPLPNGIFRSGFGMRRHPILGYMRMHTGVDWAAPRGTPIIAAGNGTVIKAGWDSGGYGNQTLITPRQRLCDLLQSPERHRQGHQGRRQGSAGTGDRLGRHDRAIDRPASALRSDRQRQQGRSAAHPPAGRQVAEGRRAREVRGRAQAHRYAARHPEATRSAESVDAASQQSATHANENRRHRCRRVECSHAHYAASARRLGRPAGRERPAGRNRPTPVTVDPSGNSPDRMRSASGSWIYCWIARFSGRAP